MDRGWKARVPGPAVHGELTTSPPSSPAPASPSVGQERQHRAAEQSRVLEEGEMPDVGEGGIDAGGRTAPPYMVMDTRSATKIADSRWPQGGGRGLGLARNESALEVERVGLHRIAGGGARNQVALNWSTIVASVA